MSVADVITELENVGVSLWEENGQLRFRAPRGVMTQQRIGLLRERKEELLAHLRDGGATLEPRPEAWGEPFPLTDVQAAYLIGRRDVYSYGGVGCHGYGELAFAELDPARLQTALRALIARHAMLRAVIDPSGAQRILPDVPPYQVRVHDLRGAPPDTAAAEFGRVRSDMDHQIYQPDRWPLFEMRVSRTDGGDTLHFSIDFLIADFISIQILLSELSQLYHHPDRPLPSLEVTFRDYLLAERQVVDTRRYETDRDYWLSRIDGLPGPPELPVLTDQRAASGRFRRWDVFLTAQRWQALRRRAGQHGVTPSGAVLAAFTEVIRRWSSRPAFTVNLTLLNRRDIHPQVNSLIGDFTSVNPLAVEADPASSFAERAKALQGRLWLDLDHRSYSGIEVLREMSRRRGGAVLMPVVFTSAIGLDGAALAGPTPAGPTPAGATPAGPTPAGTAAARATAAGPDRTAADPTGSAPAFGELGYGISQTPQVWIDCQNIERNGGLATNWDVREGVFPDGLVDDAFAAYRRLLHRLAEDDEVWAEPAPVGLPAGQAAIRAKINGVAAEPPDRLLHEAVVEQALRTPDRTAVIGADGELTYADLLGHATAVADRLRDYGCAPGAIVAVLMDKGPEQVVAVLGTVLAGAAYLPVDSHQPAARREAIMSDAGVRHALIQPWLDPGEVPDGVATIEVNLGAAPAEPPTKAPDRRAAPDDLAYVIYTSGSTGSPKGVMIEHRAALNTVLDINARFGVCPDDRILGLANLGFDLSVYDIFGPLAVGGCLVLPDHERTNDPSHWATLIATYGVTLWNSVPAQMQMLADYLEAFGSVSLPTLRLALLSGDWIPVGLPGRVRERLGGVDLVSLGGATEASIWSIYHPIDEVPADARSIPYGRPLANQSFHVLADDLRPCPDLVAGDLHIGGVGLARGYLGDTEKTAAAFVRHPGTGERIYRTGDRGRYLPDGTIEFLGRLDAQVKIRGHRIELAEVEAAFTGHPAVAAVAAMVDARGTTDRRLVAFVESARLRPDPGDPAGSGGLAGNGGPAAGGVLAAGGDLAAGGVLAAGGGLARVGAAVAGAAAQGAAEVCSAHRAERVAELARRLDEAGLLVLAGALRGAGLFTTGGPGHPFDEIVASLGAAPAFHPLVRRWCETLVRHGLLAYAPAAGTFGELRQVEPDEIERSWQSVEQARQEAEEQPWLVDYFRLSADRLPELLRGDVTATELLFPGGGTDTATAAFRDNVFSAYGNHALAGALRRLAVERTGDRPVRILEIGAGHWGAALDLVPALAGLDVEYVYSEVSGFFIQQARARFGDYPWVSFARFDMNRDHREQGFAPNDFDAIVCANSLHYAADKTEVLARLRELLRPPGWLLFSDMTQENAQVLTSLAFLFDRPTAGARETTGTAGPVGGPADRPADGVFLSRAEWVELLGGCGGTVHACLPAHGDPLSALGVHVLVASLKPDLARVDDAELRSHLARRLPEYMIPSQIQVLDRLPLTSNGKIDRTRLAALVTHGRREEAADGGDGAGGGDLTDLEKRLAEVWVEVLPARRVGRDDDFFGLGGDSLLAARLVGLIVERLPEAATTSFDDLLRRMLGGPTLGELAAALTDVDRGSTGASAADPALSLVRFTPAGDASTPVGGTATRAGTALATAVGESVRAAGTLPAVGAVPGVDAPPEPGILPKTSALPGERDLLRVLVHDGAGTLAPFGDLAVELASRGPLVGLAVPDPVRFLDLEPRALVEVTAYRYSRALLAERPTRLHIVGAGVTGVLAAEVARQLIEAGAEVPMLTIVGGYRPPYEIDDDLALEYLYAVSRGVDVSALDYPVAGRDLPEVFAAAAEMTGHVPAAALSNLDEVAGRPGVGDGFARLAARSRGERLAALAAAAPEANLPVEELGLRLDVLRHTVNTLARHEPGYYGGDLTVIENGGNEAGWPPDTSGFWADLCLGRFRVERLPANPAGGVSGSPGGVSGPAGGVSGSAGGVSGSAGGGSELAGVIALSGGNSPSTS